MPKSVTVLAGTTKGLFLLKSDDGRRTWKVTGPHCDGWPINHAIGDPETGTIWAAGGGEWPGAGVWRSDDGGESWTLSQLSNGKMDAFLAADEGARAYLGRDPAPPAPYGDSINTLWSLAQVGGRLYAGAKPAALYQSDDRGATWQPVDGLNNHPSGPSWEPGGAGLVLHTILTDTDHPERMWVGISAAGVFATEDGGKTWDRRNRLSNADGHDHDHDGHSHGNEIGFCVHNMVKVAGSDLLYQQNHHGVFRSQDGGRSWQDITAGLPSNFGFPIAVHPANPQTVWVLPLNGDTKGRFPPGARALVWRSRDGGESWEALGNGLPEKDCYFTVLRQAMAVDHGPQPGLYFGTNSGSVFASIDEGDRWSEIARHLPTVLCIETVTVTVMA